MKVLFGERLKGLRLESGLSQAQLSEKLNTTQRKISYWESGKTEPSLSDLLTISLFFEVSLDYLVGKIDY